MSDLEALAQLKAARTRPTIAVVSSWWGDYGKYEPAWRDAVAALTVQPDEIIAEPCRNYSGMGKARNEVIAQCDTEWVVYLDIDDIIKPTAIADTLPHLQTADVVVWNYVEVGGPHDGQVRSFHNSAAFGALLNGSVAMSSSPFRKALWEQMPYLEIPETPIGIDSAVDTFLWIGFHKIGAVFRNIPGVQVEYTIHQDSAMHSKTDLQHGLANRFAALIMDHDPRHDRRGLGDRLVPVPQWVQRDAVRLAQELGVPVSHLFESLWSNYKTGR